MTSKREAAVLMQFAKWPAPGSVKTRLAATLGAEQALAAHVRLTRHVLDNLLASGLPLEFWWDHHSTTFPAAAAPLMKLLNHRRLPQRLQRGKDLGERMTGALADGLESHEKAIIVGSDCPEVDATYLNDALEALESRDLVLGPSADGGYVLIGARRTTAGMLDTLDWGTSRVLAQTCRRLDRAGLSWCCLRPSWDVDELSDWHRFRALYGD